MRTRAPREQSIHVGPDTKNAHVRKSELKGQGKGDGGFGNAIFACYCAL